MCGIVGYIGKRDAAPILLEGLHQLEYRGYDSAGIAILSGGQLRVSKCAGKVRALEAQLPQRFKGTIGIAHTRWATHGEPSDANAHPHCDAANRLAIVHNGIIENYAALRSQLEAKGVVFRSNTDSEVMAHLIAAMPEERLIDSVRAALRFVTGTYGLAVIDAERPDSLVVARLGSPVLLGIGEHEMFFASDAAALVRYTKSVVHLDDGEIAEVQAGSFATVTLDGGSTSKSPSTLSWSREDYGKDAFAHFMRKEISDQRDAVSRTLSGRLEQRFQTSHLGGIELSARELLDVRRIKILGCGSAYIAGCLGAQMIEQLARLPANAEPASEFRYRNPVIESDTLYIAVSQSGETFDTLAAVQEIKRKGGRVLGVVNVVGSSIARECGRGVYIHAGPEIAVVSTKTFTCTAVAFGLLALHLGRLRDLSTSQGAELVTALAALPGQISDIVARESEIAVLARLFAGCEHAYFVGRSASFAVAMEGALKMKEVSYLHAEAYPA
jgi:glucosamine--fructose-6-phosphate aminotransferase (isomerizing)